MNRVTASFFLVLSGVLVSSQVWADDLPYQRFRVLTMETANKAAMAAARDCTKKGHQVAVAVTDRYGNLLAFARSPLSRIHAIDVAQNKAYTAASIQGATEVLGKRLSYLKGVNRFALTGGGRAIRVGGNMYGAIGVAGAIGKKTPGDVDDGCAKAGINAIRDDLELAE